MKKYDIDMIRNMVSIEDVIYRLGLETKRIGRKTSVLCPLHDDTHFGSAYIEKNGIYCYVCNQYFDIFSLYMNWYHLSFKEAVSVICDTFSIVGESEEQADYMPFKRYELKIIGLAYGQGKCYYPIGMRRTNGTLNGYVMKKEKLKVPITKKSYGEEEYYTISKKGTGSWESLNELYQKERPVFKEILEQKCEETYKRLADNYQIFRAIFMVLPKCKMNTMLMWVCLETMYEVQRILQRVKEL